MPVIECVVAVLSFVLCLSCVGKAVVAQVEHQPHKTIRHIRCELLVEGGKRCSFCESHRNTLRVLLGRHDKVAPCLNPDRTNYRYLSTPEKVERLHGMRKRQHTLEKQVARLKSRLEEAIMHEGVQVDESLHSDLQQISRESEDHVSTLGPANSFQRLFWMQQQKAASLNNSRSMRWHPLFIKWCLYIKHLSSKAYETIRDSGCISLPSQRTLRDYTHFVESTSGFSAEQLLRASEVSTTADWEKCVCLVMDEMYIKEDLVYNKHSGELVGFANLGETNDQLLQLQKNLEGEKEDNTAALAKTMFVLMVRGFFVRLNFPYVQFPCTTMMSGDLLFDLVWEAVYRLERMQLKVLAITADGASTNRLFLKMHNPNAAADEITYKVYNPHAPDGRFLYFFSDAPHLMKTVRNAWESKKRQLWVC